MTVSVPLHIQSSVNDTDSPIDLPRGLERVVVVLIKPTSYDDDGFPYRFLRGVLPTNSLAVMHALTRHALAKTLPLHVSVEIYAYEDGIRSHADKLGRLMARFPEDGTKLIVGMVAVQSAQFPRACDLMDRWQSRGATCVIGGFHVSGSISTMLDGIDDPKRPGIPSPHAMPREIRAFMDRGVIRFWITYAGKKWHLLVNPWTYRWHVYMLPYAFTEVVYTLRFALQFRRLVKATT